MAPSQERLAFEVDLQTGFFLRDVRVDHLDEGAAEFLPGGSRGAFGLWSGEGDRAAIAEPAIKSTRSSPCAAQLVTRGGA